MLIRGARVLVLVLRGADFALPLIVGFSRLFRFFKYAKLEISPHDTTDLASRVQDDVG